jgi:hypothetical protein
LVGLSDLRFTESLRINMATSPRGSKHTLHGPIHV